MALLGGCDQCVVVVDQLRLEPPGRFVLVVLAPELPPLPLVPVLPVAEGAPDCALADGAEDDCAVPDTPCPPPTPLEAVWDGFPPALP